MSTFKRSSNFKRSEGGYSRKERSGGSSGRSSGGGFKRGGGKGKSNFTRIGSLTIPKSVDKSLRREIMNNLRDSDIKLNIKVFPPKGVDSIQLDRDDLIVISFRTFEDTPDFVVGNAMIPNNDGESEGRSSKGSSKRRRDEEQEEGDDQDDSEETDEDSEE